MISIGYTSQCLTTALVIFNVLENLNVFLKMPPKVRHLLNFQISCYQLLLTLLTCCATNVSNNLNFYMMRFLTLCQKCTTLSAQFCV
jgi:hypothetical protein